MSKIRPFLSRSLRLAGGKAARRVGLLFAFGALAFAAPAVAVSPDPFTGLWSSPDTDGDLVRFVISPPSAAGTRFLVGFDPSAEACDGGRATARGVGRVAGDTLTARLTVRCDAQVHFVGTFHFVASGGTLISDTSLAPYTRVGRGR